MSNIAVSTDGVRTQSTSGNVTIVNTSSVVNGGEIIEANALVITANVAPSYQYWVID